MLPVVEGLKVLVVEDDAACRQLINNVLSRAGFLTTEATDGAVGLAALKTVEPTIVVLDLNMPNVDGFGFLEAVAKIRKRSKPSILVLTARNAREDVKRCISLGAKDFLAKPFSNDTLVSRVARLARGSSTSAASQSVKRFEEAIAMMHHASDPPNLRQN
jgi:two-component system OmpR family response regulator